MASREKSALVIGTLVADVIIKLPKELRVVKENMIVPFDSKIKLDQVHMDSEGSAHNITVNLSKLGTKAYILGRVGKDYNGQLIKECLSKYKVNTEYLNTDKKEITGVSLVFISNGEKTILSYRGANSMVGPNDLDSKILKKLGVLVFTSNLGDKNIHLLKKAISNAKKEGVPILANPSISMITHRRTELEKFLKSSDIIIMNEKEACTLTKKKSVKDSVNVLGSYGAKTVIVTRDKQGCISLEDGKLISIPAYKVRVVDTTGGGDSFTAGYIHAKFKGFDTIKAIKFANAVASLNIMTPGASVDLPSERKVLNFMKRAR